MRRILFGKLIEKTRKNLDFIGFFKKLSGRQPSRLIRSNGGKMMETDCLATVICWVVKAAVKPKKVARSLFLLSTKIHLPSRITGSKVKIEITRLFYLYRSANHTEMNQPLGHQ
jgi:hypothetical protein